jgi:hypothetical protein
MVVLKLLMLKRLETVPIARRLVSRRAHLDDFAEER